MAHWQLADIIGSCNKQPPLRLYSAWRTMKWAVFKVALFALSQCKSITVVRDILCLV